MLCIYCGGLTQVVNSRPQKRLNTTWRRRKCLGCQAIFTTEEAADLTHALLYKDKRGHLKAFRRDILFVSVYEACGHLKNAETSANALTATIISKILRNHYGPAIDRDLLIRTTTEVLKHFNRPAATVYRAYHPL